MKLEPILILPDLHCPFHDVRAWNLFLKVGKALKPKHLVVIGDLADFYCVTPETKILTADLRWVPAGTLAVGDELIGFDEKTSKRVPNSVVATARVQRHVFKLHFSDGTIVRCSKEHPWLCAAPASKNRKWRTTEELIKGGRGGAKYRVVKFTSTWEVLDGKDAGYVAGMFDGEGHICLDTASSGNSFRVGFAQKPNEALCKVIDTLTKHEVPMTTHLNKIGVQNTMIGGRWYNKLRFLGMFRPPRLLAKFKECAKNAAWTELLAAKELVHLVSFEDEGMQEVAAFETSSHTYIAEGLAAHNSVSSHSKDPGRTKNLEWEVTEVNAALDQLDALKAKHKYYIAGNHEDRLTRYLQDKAPELFGTVSIPGVLNLKERGWLYTPYKDHTKIGKLRLTHDVGTAGRYAVHKALDTYQHSIVTGHTHRLGYLVEGNAEGEHKLSASFGWLGDADKIDYMARCNVNKNWALGFGVGYTAPSTGIAYLVPVPILNVDGVYSCVVEGTYYEG